MKIEIDDLKSFAQNVGPAVLNFLRNNGYCGTKTINDGIQTKINRHFTSFDIPVSDIRMSIFYRNITCQRHPPVIELFLLFGTVNHYFWQPKALIGFFFILYVAGPAGNTKTHILKCYYDEPRISAVISKDLLVIF